MDTQVYVATSAQLALQRRLETLANNMANVSTTGFRAEEISFEELLSATRKDQVSFVSQGASHLSLRAGEITRTGNPLDVAVRGESWLSVQEENGTAYTRDGRMQMTADGILTDVNGRNVLDASGSPIQLDPSAGVPVIGPDGTVSQNNRRIGALGLFRMDPTAVLTRGKGATVMASVPATAELDFTANGVSQGYIERSNVNGVTEMTKLIAIQRSFEAVTSTITEMTNAQTDTIRTLSGS